jgi:nucleotide-binding universal stress UspA family protein
MNFAIRSVIHPTDFSDLSGKAFAHALRIALSAKSTLHLLHVAERDDGQDDVAFPHVQRILAQWELIEDNTSSLALDQLGIRIVQTRLDHQDVVHGITGFLNHNPADLVVLATHGRDGLEHWLKGSVAEMVFRRAPIPTLFIAPGTRGFVSQVSGDIRLRRVLVPVDHSPAPERAVEAARLLAHRLTGNEVTMHLLHVGKTAPVLRSGSSDDAGGLPVLLRSGNIVKSIVDAAVEFEIDMIGMPTAGHHGVLDALRGSTTECVLRHAPCPLLAISVA